MRRGVTWTVVLAAFAASVSGCDARRVGEDPDWIPDGRAADAARDAQPIDAGLPDASDDARVQRDALFDAAPIDAAPIDAEVDAVSDATPPDALPADAAPEIDLGPPVACPDPRLAPVPIRVAPGRWIDLVAPDWPGARYRWQILRAPNDSTALLGESPAPIGALSPDDADTPGAAFYPDISGEYFIELVMATPDCRDRRARFAVRAINLAALHIELVWNTPGDPEPGDGEGTDLDLHLLHPNAFDWNDGIWDCHYANPAPDWGRQGRADDDPRLDVDDVDGEGPEHITIQQTEATDAIGGPYRLGVQYFSAASFGRSEAVIRIFSEGALVRELRRDVIASGDLWIVADIFTAPLRIDVIDTLTAP